MLTKERKRLRDVDAFTMLDYIKTSIEILMNMKMDENGGDDKAKKKRSKDSSNNNLTGVISDTESMKSMEEPPKDYEVMLQKYEAEVRNHIKIE
mmetsp:Transcript_7096/g.5354  ORF Transcript_7096/g.5354 Transcript_7096/m.5354 type:complete len:94 (-) Transcript_7096:681-962(-)